MRIALYNRWLHTQGGGERHSLALVAVLAQRHAVSVVTHQPVDLDQIGAFLGLDLGALTLKTVPDSPTLRHVAALSAGYDGFVGASHTEVVPAQARRNALLVYFPAAFPPAPNAPVVLNGWYGVEQGDHGPFRWSEGRATMTFEPSNRSRTAWLLLAAPHTQTPVTFRAGGEQAIKRLTPTPRWTAVDVPPQVTHIDIETLPFYAPHDPRELGVIVYALRWASMFRRSSITATEMVVQPMFQPQTLAHYELILANSHYTQGWIERRWKRTSSVLYPPVALSTVPLPKQPLILSVGRFFPTGHSKNHAVLIDAFKQLYATDIGNWRLALVGSLDTAQASHQAYFDALQHLIDDAPITLHANLPAEQLRQLWSEASIYWHAGGFGIDAEREPERVEHFGITVAEALGSGAVPLVYAAGGPAEIVRNEHNGLHWHTPDELITLTRHLIAQPDRRQALAAAGRTSAERFSMTAFERRVWKLFGEWG